MVTTRGTEISVVPEKGARQVGEGRGADTEGGV